MPAISRYIWVAYSAPGEAYAYFGSSRSSLWNCPKERRIVPSPWSVSPPGGRAPGGRPGERVGRTQPGVGELGPDLELVGLGLVVGAVVALVHQGGFLGVQL